MTPLVVVCALPGRLFPEVEAALRDQWPAFQVHWDDPAEDATYADFLRRAWNRGAELVIVEGDSIPPPGSIARLLACREPWCAHASWVGERYEARSLALAKFSTRLQLAHPWAMEWAATRGRPIGSGKATPPKQLDTAICRVLDILGVACHPHEPPARHLRYANEPGAESKSPATPPLHPARRGGGGRRR